MKKDILFLCQFFYPEYNSSATLPFDTAQALAAHGFSVDALCGYPKEYSNIKSVPLKEIKNGIGIHRLRYIQLDRTKNAARLLNYFSFTFSVLLRLGTFRNYKSIIVYSNPPILPIVAVLANMLFGTKIVFVAYDIYPEIAYASGNLKPGCLIDKAMRLINRMMYKRVSKVVALTDEMKEFILTNRVGVTEDQVVVIPNWAHEGIVEATPEAYERFGYTPGQFIVSYFGNMGICQEMDTLMDTAEMMKNYEDVRFMLVGHGIKKTKIEARIKERELTNVQLIDFLTGEAFEQAVAISSCGVVSLEKGLKGLCAPSKYYTYLQGGKPVVVVAEKDSYLYNEIAMAGIGFSIKIGKPKRLMNVLCNMRSDTELALDCGCRARSLYESAYKSTIGLKKYVDLF